MNYTGLTGKGEFTVREDSMIGLLIEVGARGWPSGNFYIADVEVRDQRATPVGSDL